MFTTRYVIKKDREKNKINTSCGMDKDAPVK